MAIFLVVFILGRAIEVKGVLTDMQARLGEVSWQVLDWVRCSVRLG